MDMFCIDYEAMREGKGKVEGFRYVLADKMEDVADEAEFLVWGDLKRRGKVTEVKIVGIERVGRGILDDPRK